MICSRYSTFIVTIRNYISRCTNTTNTLVSIYIGINYSNIFDSCISKSQKANKFSSFRIISIRCIIEIQTTNGMTITIKYTFISISTSTYWSPRTERTTIGCAISFEYIRVYHNISKKHTVNVYFSMLVYLLCKPIKVCNIGNGIVTDIIFGQSQCTVYFTCDKCCRTIRATTRTYTFTVICMCLVWIICIYWRSRRTWSSVVVHNTMGIIQYWRVVISHILIPKQVAFALASIQQKAHFTVIKTIAVPI